jgi:hypothetical protein
MLLSSHFSILTLHRACLYRLGASIFGDVPLSQLASQKGVFAPSPIKITVEEKTMFCPFCFDASEGISKDDHECPSHVRAIEDGELFQIYPNI